MSRLPVATTWYEDDGLRLSLAGCFQLNNGMPQVTGKAGENVNIQGKGGTQLTLDKKDRRLLGVVTHPRRKRVKHSI